MLKGLFPRLFGNFREGGIIHAKFVTTAGPLFALKVLSANNANGNYQMTLAKNATAGRLTLTVPAARNIALLNASHIAVSSPGTIASILDVFYRGAVISESTGVLDLLCVNVATDTAQDAAALDELHFTLMVDK